MHPVRKFFYEHDSQPCFAFERTFPLHLLEKNFQVTGDNFSYSYDEYLKYSYIYKALGLLLKDALLFESVRIFLSRILPSLPGILSKEHLEVFEKDIENIKDECSSSEYNAFSQYRKEKLDKTYLFANHTLSFNIWSKWLDKSANFHFLHSYLSFNEQKFREAYEMQFYDTQNSDIQNSDIQSEKSPYILNAQWLGEFFQLSPRDNEILKAFAFELLHEPMTYVMSQSSTLRYESFEILEQIDFFSQLYCVEPAQSLLKNKLLVDCGLVADLLKGDNFFLEIVAEKKPLLSFFDAKLKLLLGTRFQDKKALASVLVDLEKEFATTLGIEDYAYLEPDISNILESFKSQEPMDILFWGAPGTGKTELSRVIAKENGFSLCNITQYDKQDRDIYYKNQRIMQLVSAKNFAPVLGSYIVLVDEAENILHAGEHKHILTQQLENKKVHTVWIVNKIESIDPAYLRRFDYIQEIKAMPFDKRRALCERLLGPGDLSYKIAQAMHTPAEIVAAIDWCRRADKFTWETVQLKMAAYQKALSKVEKNQSPIQIEIIPPEHGRGLDNFAGYEYIHESAYKIKDLFNHPEKYQKMGSKVPKGILLAGEPGVGKTLFARCLASEISIPIVKADCSMLATYPGAIAELFEIARSHAPCMIFLDEIDVIASSVMDNGGANTEKQKILNQLLIQMEGFDPLEGVLVLGATHRDYLLDKAVLRSGRFGETIHIRKPSSHDRVSIWKHYVYQGRSLSCVADDINFDTLGRLSATMSAADINQCVNMAATSAALQNKTCLCQDELEEATNKLFWGTNAQGMPMTPKEQWRTAIHEAGHALIALKNNRGIRRITVRPHQNFLGAVDLESSEGTYSTTLEEIKQNAEILLGGMTAEGLVFSNHASGVVSDLAKASSFIMDALLSYGMGKTLGSVVITHNTPAMSDMRLSALECEHKAILDKALEGVQVWMTKEKSNLISLASLLIEKRSIAQSELYRWFHQKDVGLPDTEDDMSMEELIARSYQAIL